MELIGSGSYGFVYSKDGIAIKISFNVLSHCFTNEKKALEAIHDINVIKLLDSFDLRHKHGFTHGLKLELCECDITFYKIPDFDDFVAQVLSGLAAIHRAGIIHRDISTANILVLDGVYKYIDFGLCCFKTSSKNFNVYCELCRPPEVRQKRRYTNTADVWALGKTIEVYGTPPDGMLIEEPEERYL